MDLYQELILEHYKRPHNWGELAGATVEFEDNNPLCGDEIRIAGNAMMMIHNPVGVAVGEAKDMQHIAALLDQIKQDIVAAYADASAQLQKRFKSAVLWLQHWIIYIAMGWCIGTSNRGTFSLMPTASRISRISAWRA